MTASAENLLEQILFLEMQLRHTSMSGGDTTEIEKQLLELKEKFQLMNENLSNPQTVLKD